MRASPLLLLLFTLPALAATPGTDAKAEFPKDVPVRPEDITKTVYYAMGIDNLEAMDRLGRPYNLLEDGKPLVDLFG